MTMNNLPKLRFPEFTDGWESKSLGELLEFKNGINASKEQYGQGVKFINVLDILNNDYITYDKIIGSVDIDFETVSKFPVKFGDILFQRSSETREEVGSASVYLDKENTATFGGFVIRGRKIGEYDPVFLNKLLKTDIARNDITSKSGGSTRYNVGQEILSNVSLPLPTLPEQTKIASFLTAVDERLNQLKQKKTLLEQYKKGVMQKIFDQEIRFKDDDGKEFPDWDTTKFGLLYSFKSTNSYSRDNLNYESGKVKNIHYGDIHTKFKPLLDTANEFIPYINNEVDISKIPSENYCKEGDLIIADASEDYNDIGKAIEVYNLNNEKVVAGLHTILAKPDLSRIALGFGAYLMKAEYIHFQIRVISQGTKVLGLSSNRLSEVSVKLPCVNEQTKIANFLTAIDEKISLCNTQINKTEQYKKGLLQQMFV